MQYLSETAGRASVSKAKEAYGQIDKRALHEMSQKK